MHETEAWAVTRWPLAKLGTLIVIELDMRWDFR